jgi:hypothetical protein
VIITSTPDEFVKKSLKEQPNPFFAEIKKWLTAGICNLKISANSFILKNLPKVNNYPNSNIDIQFTNRPSKYQKMTENVEFIWPRQTAPRRGYVPPYVLAKMN